MSGWSRSIPPQTVADDNSSVGSVVIGPAASKGIVSAGAIGPGLWYVKCITQFSGTVTATDVSNAMLLVRGPIDAYTTEIAQLYTTPAANGAIVPLEFVINMPNATDLLQIAVDAGVTPGGSCGYNALLIWYLIAGA